MAAGFELAALDVEGATVDHHRWVGGELVGEERVGPRGAGSWSGARAAASTALATSARGASISARRIATSARRISTSSRRAPAARSITVREPREPVVARGHRDAQRDQSCCQYWSHVCLLC